MGVQHRLPLLGHQGGDGAEAGGARGDGGGLDRDRGAAGHGAGAAAGAATGTARPGRRGPGRGTAGGEAAHQVARGAAGRPHGTGGSAPSRPRRGGRARISTSPTPFSSICQARASTGTESWSASAAPRVRSASGSSAALAQLGDGFQPCERVHELQQVVRAAGRDRRRVRGALGDGQRRAPACLPSPLPCRSNTASRSARPSISATWAAAIGPSSPCSR